jgi:hypothetical protein
VTVHAAATMLFWTVSVMNRPFPSSSLPQVVLLAFLRVYGVPWPWTQRLYFAMESVGSIRVEEAVRRRELLVYRALLQVVEPGPCAWAAFAGHVAHNVFESTVIPWLSVPRYSSCHHRCQTGRAAHEDALLHRHEPAAARGSGAW